MLDIRTIDNDFVCNELFNGIAFIEFEGSLWFYLTAITYSNFLFKHKAQLSEKILQNLLRVDSLTYSTVKTFSIPHATMINVEGLEEIVKKFSLHNGVSKRVKAVINAVRNEGKEVKQDCEEAEEAEIANITRYGDLLREDKSLSSNYRELSAAIIKQALIDYASALRKNDAYEIQRMEDFFLSGDYQRIAPNLRVTSEMLSKFRSRVKARPLTRLAPRRTESVNEKFKQVVF